MTPPPGHPTDRPQLTGTSPKTNHAEQARECLILWKETANESEREILLPAVAQVHATLALVDEQRTANLIALWGALRNPPAGIRPTTAQWVQVDRLDDLIAARLDLTQDMTP